MEIGGDKLILIIYGQYPSIEHLKLANKFNITIWTYENLEHYFNQDKKKLSKELLFDLGLKKRNLFLRFINLITPIRYRKF